MPEIEVPVAGVHSRAGRQRKRKEPEVVDERTARLQKRMVNANCSHEIKYLPQGDVKEEFWDCLKLQRRMRDA